MNVIGNREAVQDLGACLSHQFCVQGELVEMLEEHILGSRPSRFGSGVGQMGPCCTIQQNPMV